MKIANILYVKVGIVTTTKLENSKRTELISGIKKYPVPKAYLLKTGFKEDFQAARISTNFALTSSMISFWSSGSSIFTSPVSITRVGLLSYSLNQSS